MAERQISFDLDRAQELKSKLDTAKQDMETALAQIQKTVDGVRDWWKGGSQEGFITNFSNGKKDVQKGLNQWLEAYKALMKEIESSKVSAETSMKQQLSK